MSDFNPGEGWREVSDPKAVDGITSVEFYDADTDSSTYWIREVPRLPLPSADYTVLVANVRSFDLRGTVTLIRLGGSRPWFGVLANAARQFSDEEITSFEVKSAPPEATAEAIAEWFVKEAVNTPLDDWRRKAARTISREFGVTA